MNNIPIAAPAELTRAALEQAKPRYVFFPHWSHIIPEDIHGAFECVIFHMTDLPFGRGGSPLQNLIARGIKPAGCIVGEPTSMRLVSAHKGGRVFRCRVTGRAAHSSLTHTAVNAIEYADGYHD